MYYDTKVGIIKNIENALKRVSQLNGIVQENRGKQFLADIENREAVEQSLTDLYLDGVQAQQDLTDLQIQILEGAK